MGINILVEREGAHLHHVDKGYDLERVEQSYYKKDEIQFNKRTYSPLIVTASKECPIYDVSHDITARDVEALRAIVAERSISEMTHKPRY